MRILHVLNHTCRLSGNVHAAVDLACAQADAGHSVAICSGGGSFDEVLARHRVAHVRLDHTRRPLVLARSLVRLARFCRNWQPEVVHAHMVTSVLLAWPVTRACAIPLVTTVHNEFQRSAPLMGLSDRVIAVSEAVRDRLRRRGIPAARLRVILNGTIGSARHPAVRPAPATLAHPALLFVGGMHPRKGVSDLIRAMRLVRDKSADAHLYLVGEGPMQAEYEALAQELGLGDAVTFAGALDDPRSYLSAADIFVLPSLSDPAPLVISEAREAGCAVVATRVDGIPEMLDRGAAGILVEPGRPDGLAAALLHLIGDDAALARQKAAAAADTARFSVERVARDAVEVYREIAAARQAAATARDTHERLDRSDAPHPDGRAL